MIRHTFDPPGKQSNDLLTLPNIASVIKEKLFFLCHTSIEKPLVAVIDSFTFGGQELILGITNAFLHPSKFALLRHGIMTRYTRSGDG